MKPHPLKIERERHGWSQSYVADTLGVSVRTVSRWEQRQANPYPYYRTQLSTLFDKSIMDLGLLIEKDPEEEGIFDKSRAFPTLLAVQESEASNTTEELAPASAHSTGSVAHAPPLNDSVAPNKAFKTSRPWSTRLIFKQKRRNVLFVAIIILLALIASFHPYLSLLFPAQASSGHSPTPITTGVVKKGTTPVSTANNQVITEATNQSNAASTVLPKQEFIKLKYSRHNTFTNLTSLGTTDWEQWGYNGVNSVNRKAGVPPQISNYTLHKYSTSVGVDHANPIDCGWSDGIPTPSISTTRSAISVTGSDGGFQLTVPARPTIQTLRVYVGTWLARGEISVSFDGKNRFTNAQLNTTSGPVKANNAVYTITFSSNVTENLRIVYQEKENSSSQSYVLLEAATLSPL